MMLRRLQDLPDASRMPPLASNELDPAGINLIRDWVLSIAPNRDVVREAEALARTSAGANTVIQNDPAASAGVWIHGRAAEIAGPSMIASGLSSSSYRLAHAAYPSSTDNSTSVSGTFSISLSVLSASAVVQSS